MPQCNFSFTGDIKDFTRVDNLYTVLKRELDKFLTAWKIEVEIKFSEEMEIKPEE